MDVKLCGVDYQEGDSNLPWTKAVLFKNGSEVCCTEPAENPFGQWTINADGKTFEIVLVCAN